MLVFGPLFIHLVYLGGVPIFFRQLSYIIITLPIQIV